MTWLKVLGVTAALVLHSVLVSAQSGELPGVTCNDPAAIHTAQQIVDTWKDAYNRGDPARVAGLYSVDAYYLTQHFVSGVVQGRAAIQAYVKRGVDAGYHLDSLRILAVGCSAEMMYVITRYDAINAGQSVFGVNLVVLRKDAQNWRIVAHEAAVPDPATAIRALDGLTVQSGKP